jgi:hypothetical protein
MNREEIIKEIESIDVYITPIRQFNHGFERGADVVKRLLERGATVEDLEVLSDLCDCDWMDGEPNYFQMGKQASIEYYKKKLKGE